MNRAYLLLILAGLLVIVGAVGYRHGYKAAETQAQADLAARLRLAIAQADAIAAQDREVLSASEQRRERIRTVFQPIETEALRYVALHITDAECLDPDGLRLWHAANLGPDAPPSAAPAHALPAPAAAGLGQGAGPAPQPHPDGQALSRLPGTAPSPGGLGFRPHWGWQ